jgi:hypothetical protein
MLHVLHPAQAVSMSKTRPNATIWVLDLLFLDPHHHHPLKEIPLPVWQSELYLFSAVFRFMFCPHLHCRNLGLPHVIGAGIAVIYMSLVGPTSIYRELEILSSEIGYLDTATSLWNRLMQFWNCDAHLRDNPPFTSTSKRYGRFFRMNFHQKSRTCEIWQYIYIDWPPTYVLNVHIYI